MKKKIIKVLLIAIVIVGYVACGYYESCYTRKGCKVIRKENNIDFISDSCGNIWKWEENEGDLLLAVGDIVDLKMNTNGTTLYIDDDIIKSIEK